MTLIAWVLKNWGTLRLITMALAAAKTGTAPTLYVTVGTTRLAVDVRRVDLTGP